MKTERKWLAEEDENKGHTAIAKIVEENRVLLSMNKALMDNDQFGILVTDLDGTVMEFNRTAENLLGKKADHVLGSYIGNIQEIGQYVVEALTAEKRFEKIHVFVGRKLEQASLVDTFPLYDEDSRLVGAFAQLHDITEVCRVHERFNYLTNYDELTGIPNRKFLESILAEWMGEDARYQDKGGLTVVHLGLDRFKVVNDTLGYADGNDVLKKIVQRLQSSLKTHELIARVGGDEFIIVAPYADAWENEQIGERLHTLFNEPFMIKGYEFHMTASMGIALYPDDASTPEDLLFKAEVAKSYAERNGKNQFVLYTKRLDFDSHERILLEASFRKAMDLNELVLHYQPKIDMKTGLISGIEALVRWQHPEKGLISPTEFIPLAEELGLISRLDEWVLREACEQNKRWQEMGFTPMSVAVNLSSSQFMSHKLIRLVETILKETGLEAEYLELEITETMAMNVNYAIPTLKRLNALGVQISLDDFGTGYSSMNYLTKFAIDSLKIDRSFIWNIEKGESDSIIVSTMIRMAHGLGLKVIAEGVEDTKQLQFLNEHGCDEVQGFIFSKPVPAEEIESQFLATLNG